MVKGQLKSRFAPDKDGKLKPVYTLTTSKADPPSSASQPPVTPATAGHTSWYGRLWLWVKKRVF